MLATRAGVDLKRYELAETGRRPLKSTDVTRIAAAANVPPGRVQAAHGRDVARHQARRVSPADAPRSPGGSSLP
jgi:hypothetical protein